jgi:alkylation response protein AidB-like acyl-CoA dehydrogenase
VSTTIDRQVDPAQVRALTEQVLADHAGDDDATLQGALYDAGLAWVSWPVGSGGLGAEPAMQDVIDTTLDAAGRRPEWFRNPMGVGMVGPAIAAHGTDEQRARFLRPAYTAEEIWCQLFSEPGAGSDVATLSTRAVRDGDEWVVNGQKVWTSAAHLSRFGLLLARTDPDVPKHQGITAFLMDMSLPGIEIRPLRQMNGDAHFNEVYMTDVRLPDSARLGGVGEGWRVAVTTLMNERVSIGGMVEAKGTSEIRLVLDTWRRKGGDAVARDQVARLWIEAEVLRLGKLRAQQQRERGVPGPEGSVLKLSGALLHQRTLSFAVDLLGADGMLISGYDGEMSLDDIGRLFLRMQSSTIAGGTSEIMRNILGERVLGLPPEPRADKDVAWTEIPKGA